MNENNENNEYGPFGCPGREKARGIKAADVHDTGILP